MQKYGAGTRHGMTLYLRDGSSRKRRLFTVAARAAAARARAGSRLPGFPVREGRGANPDGLKAGEISRK